MWSVKLLQDSDPILAARGTLKRKEIMVFHTAQSESADFLLPEEERARGNDCLTLVWQVMLYPKGQWKSLVLIPVLCSFPIAALSVLGNADCSAVAALNGT